MLRLYGHKKNKRAEDTRNFLIKTSLTLNTKVTIVRPKYKKSINVFKTSLSIKTQPN